MKAFLIIFVIATVFLGLSNGQLCNPACTRQYDPHCGVTSAQCLVPAANSCILAYKSCILNQYHLSPIVDVLPGNCPTSRPLCSGI